MTPDGDFVVVGVEAVPVTIYWGGPANPTPPGLVLVDARDRTLPRVVGYAPANLGVHSVTSHRIGGVDWIYSTDLGSATPQIYRIEREPVPRLVSTSLLLGTGSSTPFDIGHDAVAYDDPLTGKPLLATADGDDFGIWDLSLPNGPVRLARFDGNSGYAHSALLTSIEGRRVLIATSEDWEDDTASRAWIVDATDLTNLQVLGTWTAGVPAGPGYLRYSLHNPRVHEGTLYLAHYHAGVVAIDVSTLEKARAPVVTAYSNAAHDTGYANPLPDAMTLVGWGGVHAPFVLDVEVDPASGALYAADTFFGVTTFQTRP